MWCSRQRLRLCDATRAACAAPRVLCGEGGNHARREEQAVERRASPRTTPQSAPPKRGARAEVGEFRNGFTSWRVPRVQASARPLGQRLRPVFGLSLLEIPRHAHPVSRLVDSIPRRLGLAGENGATDGAARDFVAVTGQEWAAKQRCKLNPCASLSKHFSK
jgi:hypothetical protein